LLIPGSSIQPFDFDGLVILDYTAGGSHCSSVAEVRVAAGTGHKQSFSRRSTKYYFVLDGTLHLTVDGKTYELARGDLAIVPVGTVFSYSNKTGTEARLLLVHTPSFELDQEVFPEEDVPS
jgi:mannose-6-phosphate isomerase-like protein (cupin superfamily)